MRVAFNLGQAQAFHRHTLSVLNIYKSITMVRFTVVDRTSRGMKIGKDGVLQRIINEP